MYIHAMTLDETRLDRIKTLYGGEHPSPSEDGDARLCVVEARNFAMVINYGLNKVRFPAPLKEGQRYRLALKVQDARDAGSSVEGLLAATIEVEGETKPACVAEIVYRFFG